MTIIIPANSAADTGFSVANSCRFNDGDSAYLSRTLGTPTDNNVWTFSFWIKRGILGSAMQLFDSDTGSGDEGYLMINAGNDPAVNIYDSAGNTAQFNISRKLRDPSAWMHIVWNFNSGDSTAGDRMQIWYNGVRGTDFTTNTQPALNDGSTINEAKAHRIGAKMNDSRYFDGYLAEVVFIDGSALAPTSFGEFDEDSPTIWKPKDVSGLTFGDNGFYLDFEDSSALGNDVSGNNNDWTANNLAAADQATDTPTNNFCTLNPLIRQVAEETGGLSEGNTEVLFSGASWGGVSSTMAPAAGKWYFEGKLIANGSNSIIGVVPANTQGKDNTGTWYIGQYSGEQAYQNNGAASNGGASFGNTYTDGDIIGVALDCDNAKVYFSKNGTLENSGDPSSGATGTGAMSLTAGEFYTPAVSGNGVTNWEMNFGNPPYANSSDAADANGYGAFEYAPPSGYLALCTKNLGSDGG